MNRSILALVALLLGTACSPDDADVAAPALNMAITLDTALHGVVQVMAAHAVRTDENNAAQAEVVFRNTTGAPRQVELMGTWRDEAGEPHGEIRSVRLLEPGRDEALTSSAASSHATLFELVVR